MKRPNNGWHFLCKPKLRSLMAGCFFFFSCGPSIILAQVRTSIIPDTTLPVGYNSVVVPLTSGPRFDIKGGRLVGTNLFHSFSDFQVDANDTANFYGQKASNILSRVTGPNPSNLFGTLGVDTHLAEANRSSANLFFLNPNGVVFGPDANLDLKGSFYVSNADAIHLSAPGIFHASDPSQDLLTTSPPSAFGFLNAPAPSLAAESSAAISVLGLDAKGSPLVVVGRDGLLPGRFKVPGVEVREGTLQNSGGVIAIASVNSTGNVPLTNAAGVLDPNLSNPLTWGFPSLGEVKLQKNGVIRVNGDPGGSVYIRGGRLTIDGTTDVDPSNSSKIQARTLGEKNHLGTAIDILVNDLSISGGGQLSANAEGISDIEKQGNAGEIKISADRITIDGQDQNNDPSGIFNRSLRNNLTVPQEMRIIGGNGGAITIRTNNLTITNGGTIATESTKRGKENSGNAGSVSISPLGINAKVTISGEGSKIYSESQSSGFPGEINITSHKFSLTNNAELTTANVNGSNTSAEGNISISADRIQLSDAKIDTSTSGTGKAGDILLQANFINLENGVSISSQSTNMGNEGDVALQSKPGSAGNIKIQTQTLTSNIKTIPTTGLPELVMDSQSGLLVSQPLGDSPKVVEISSSSLGAEITPVGRADSVIISGNAGNIKIQGEMTTPEVSLPSDRVSLFATLLNSNSQGSGNGGDITVQAKNFDVNETTFSAVSNGTGDSGDLLFQTDTFFSKNQSAFLTSSNATTNLRDQFTIATGSSSFSKLFGFLFGISRVSFTPGDGNSGNITIEGIASTAAKNVVLDSTDVNASVLGGGTANDITVTAENLFLRNQTALLARTAGRGSGGNIIFNVGNLDASQTSIVANSTGVNKTIDGSNPNARFLTDGKAGNVVIRGKGGEESSANKITLKKTDLTTEALGTGEGGSIDIQTVDTLTLTNATLSADVHNGVNASAEPTGNVAVTAPVLILTDSEITAQTTGERHAGDVTLNVAQLTATGPGQRSVISSSSTSGATGNAGNVIIQDQTADGSPVTGAISLTQTDLTTEALGTGQGGTISIATAQVLGLTNTNISASVTDLGSTEAQADAPPANVTLTAPTLTMSGGSVQAQTSGTRNAGNVTVQASTQATLQEGIDVSASTTGDGDAGDVIFEVAKLDMLSNSSIRSSSTGAGASGQVTLGGVSGAPTPGDLTFTNARISTEATGSGAAGNVTIKGVSFLQATDSIFSSSANTGEGGTITIETTDTMVLDHTVVKTDVLGGAEKGGDIVIKAGTVNTGDLGFGDEQLLIRNNSLLSAESQGEGDAGTITVESVGTLRIQDSIISTEASHASGGNIKLTSELLVHLMDSQLLSSVGGDEIGDNGGNISIDPEFVLIQNSQILANAVAGRGGNISIVSGVVLVDAFSRIDASSQFG
ncbi:MAG: filamentous hemagglutinin N-terminal domain-containing protein, partial [Nitrospira sp.]|nr:filamentous hemagglutinin N-terminal domain-containing protein [Nitrospira sp.]